MRKQEEEEGEDLMIWGRKGRIDDCLYNILLPFTSTTELLQQSRSAGLQTS